VQEQPDIIREGLEQMLEKWHSSKSWIDMASMASHRDLDEHGGSSSGGGGGEVSRQVSP